MTRAIEKLQGIVEFINEAIDTVSNLGDTWVVVGNVKDVGEFTKPVILSSGKFKEMYEAHTTFSSIVDHEKIKGLRLITKKEYKWGL